MLPTIPDAIAYVLRIESEQFAIAEPVAVKAYIEPSGEYISVFTRDLHWGVWCWPNGDIYAEC